MTFEQWLAANGYEADKLSDKTKEHLRVAYQASLPKPPEAAPPRTPDVATKGGQFDAKMAELKAKSERIEALEAITLRYCQDHIGNQEKIAEFQQLCEAAKADESTTLDKFQISMMMADRRMGPIIMSPKQSQDITNEVLEAAICQSAKLKDVEKKFSDQALQAAHTRFRRGIGLKELFLVAAERNSGYRGSIYDDAAICRAAFTRPQAQGFNGGMLAVGPSTLTVPGILSNVANKFIEQGFLFTEQSWRQFSRIKSVRDFKQISSYRMTGTTKYIKLAPGGKLKNAALGELTYTNQAETYGIMLGIDRTQIINDDLGAFTGASAELGRGGGDALNEVFWTEWLDDSTFFPTDKSYTNYDDGATDSVLSLAGLENAQLIFDAQTKPDGTPLGATARILLVPSSLRITAANLMNGEYTAAAQSTATLSTVNVFRGMYDVVWSRYLNSSAITGYSATAWYLLAAPEDIPGIEVVFLNGADMPTVQTGDFDFDALGLAMRGYFDFGCNKQEYRCGVKLKGAA